MSGRGKLSFKGDKKSKKKSSKSKHKLSANEASSSSAEAKASSQHDDPPTTEHPDDEERTAAERRSIKFKARRAKREMEKVASLSHRERVEEFNEKLGSVTELNDIPRVSAAGNG